MDVLMSERFVLRREWQSASDDLGGERKAFLMAMGVRLVEDRLGPLESHWVLMLLRLDLIYLDIKHLPLCLSFLPPRQCKYQEYCCAGDLLFLWILIPLISFSKILIFSWVSSISMPTSCQLITQIISIVWFFISFKLLLYFFSSFLCSTAVVNIQSQPLSLRMSSERGMEMLFERVFLSESIELLTPLSNRLFQLSKPRKHCSSSSTLLSRHNYPPVGTSRCRSIFVCRLEALIIFLKFPQDLLLVII